MTREEAQQIVNELSQKKKLSKPEKDKLTAALKVLANKWDIPN